MKLRKTIQPIDTAISVDELKASSNITHNDDDAILAGIIAEATDGVEAYSGLSLMDQEFTAFADEWLPYFMLEVSPIQSISIEYFDEANALQTLAPSLYYADLEAYPAIVVWKDESALPKLADGFNTVMVRIQAGFPSADNVPSALKGALILWSGSRYENVEATSPVNLREVPFGAKSLMNAYRVNF